MKTIAQQKVEKIIKQFEACLNYGGGVTVLHSALPDSSILKHFIDIEKERFNPINCFTDYICSLDREKVRHLCYCSAGLLLWMHRNNYNEYVDAFKTARNSANIKHFYK